MLYDMNRFPRDPYGDPRDYATESRWIVEGSLHVSPALHHCLASLRDVLTRKELDRETYITG